MMAKRNYAKREIKEYNFLTEVCQWIIFGLISMPLVFLFNRVKVIGRENIPKEKPFLVAPTHIGDIDPIVTSYATLRPIAYMAKTELFDVKWLRPIIVAIGVFAVNRNKLEIATIRTAKAIMKTNHWLLSMFPQGKRDKIGKITTINPGFAYLARMAKIDILPISIAGSDKNFRIPFSGNIIIRIGKPFSPSEELSDTMEEWCNAIAELGDFTVEESAKAEIQRIREKKDNYKSADSES